MNWCGSRPPEYHWHTLQARRPQVASCLTLAIWEAPEKTVTKVPTQMPTSLVLCE